MEEQRIAKAHKLVVSNRKTSMVTGVLDVLSFDLNEILLETEQGMLMVKGTDLHVNRLSVEKGEVDLSGNIDSIAYSSTRKSVLQAVPVDGRRRWLESEQKRQSFSMQGSRGSLFPLLTGYSAVYGGSCPTAARRSGRKILFSGQEPADICFTVCMPPHMGVSGGFLYWGQYAEESWHTPQFCS